MNSQIIGSAAPLTYNRGIRDDSTRAVPESIALQPDSMFKIYTLAKTGPVGEGQVVTGSAAINIFGSETFDMNGKYATHATEQIRRVMNAGALFEIERVIDPAVTSKANFRLFIDVLATAVPQYRRNTDGTYQLSAQSSQPIPVATGPATLPGLQAKFIVRQITDTDPIGAFGAAIESVGSQADQATSATSRLLPICDFEANFFGAAGSDSGVRIWAPNAITGVGMNSNIMTTQKAYPFRIACVKRPAANTSPLVFPTVNNDEFIDFCFKPGAVDTTGIGRLVHLQESFLDQYQLTDDPQQTPVYGPFGQIHVYQKNIDDVLKSIFNAEKAYFDSNSDFDATATEDDKYLINFISGMSSQLAPYYTYRVVNSSNDSVRLNESTNLMALGGTDGDTSLAVYDKAVQIALGEYTDEMSIKSNPELSPGNIFFDSGYSHDTKYAMIATMAVRHDTAVFINTHTAGNKKLSISEEISVGLNLRQRMLMYPSSDVYATPCARGFLFPQSALVPSSGYRGRLPASIALVDKLANYICSGDNVWRTSMRFDEGEAKYVTDLHDISVPFNPAPMKKKSWAAGMNWLEIASLNRYAYQALRTVYTNDTSVLNNIFFVLACCRASKVGERTRIHFSGNTTLDNGPLAKAIDARNEEQLTTAAFDTRYVITSKTIFTEQDIARNYSWTTEITIKGNGSRTVQTLTLVAARKDNATTTP